MKFILTCLCSLVIILAFSQSEKIEALIKEGVALHDKGDYTGAIDKYNKVLVYDPTSDLMNYEIAFSYAQARNFVKAIEHCNTVINGKGQSQMLAVILKGNCLDDWGKTNEADDYYKKVLKQYPNQYLLLLNFGIRSVKLGDFEKAESALLKSVELKPDYPGSHLSLAYLKLKRGDRLKGILGLYYFLLLENNTPRAAEALTMLMTNLDIPVVEKKIDSTRMTLNVSFPVSHEKLSRTDLGEVSLYLITTINAEVNRNKNKWERLSFDTNKIFTTLGELQAQGNKGVEDYWWGFYIPFFFQLKTAGHAEAFSWTIASAFNEPSITAWKAANKDKVDAFGVWKKNQ